MTPATPETRPELCRFRLQDEGKPYPRSGCKACGRTITTGLGASCHLSAAKHDAATPETIAYYKLDPAIRTAAESAIPLSVPSRMELLVKFATMMEALQECEAQSHLIKHLAEYTTERNWDDKRLYIKQAAERALAKIDAAIGKVDG